MQRILDLLEQANKYTAMILPPAASGTVAALVAYYAMEQGGIWQSEGVSWGDFIPGWLFASFVTALSAVCFAYLSFRKARQHQHRTPANVAAVAGVVTILVLTWWPTRQCDMVGGVAAGLTVAGVVVAMAMVINAQAGKVCRSIIIDCGAVIAQSNAKAEEGRIGIAPFLQISLAFFMAVVVLIAFTNDDLTESRTKLLLFAGIGITAASVISAKRSLKSVLAIAGAAVSVVGAYLEMSQSLTLSDSEIGALTILAVAGLVAGMIIMFISFDAHVVVRLAVTPFLTAVAVAGATLLIIMLPVIFISTGCSVAATGILTSVLTAGLLSLIAGSVTFAVLTGIGAHDWWKSKRAMPQTDANPENPPIQ